MYQNWIVPKMTCTELDLPSQAYTSTLNPASSTSLMTSAAYSTKKTGPRTDHPCGTPFGTGNMYINAQKSKIMVVSRQVDHEGESLEQVHDFIFLGSNKSADGDCTKEIKRRIAMARQKAVVLASIWKDRNIKTATKVKSHEVNGVGSIPVWSGGMDFEEI